MSVGIAAVGCGHWGKNIVRALSAIGVLKAVVDPNGSLAQEMASRYGVPALSWAEVLEHPGIDGVAIASPAEHHCEMACEAVRLGKHVFVEKPLALRVADGERMAAQAKENGRILMVGHLLQYHPVFERLCELADSGHFGKLKYIYSNRLNIGKIRSEEDVFWSFAPHDISMILRLTQEQPSHVRAVSSDLLGRQLADVAQAQMSFPNGISGHVFTSWLNPFKEQKLIVIGDRRMAVFDDGRPWSEKLAIYHHSVEVSSGVAREVKGDCEFVEVPEGEPLKRECQHFVDCISAGAEPTTNAEEALGVLRVLSAVRESMMADGAKTTLLQAENKGREQAEYYVHPTAIIENGATVGKGSKIWHFSHVLPDTIVGERVVIGQNVVAGPQVTIGDGCKIQNNVSLYKGVVLEEDVFCGPSCVFTNVMTPRAHIERKHEFKETYVSRGSTIGANATIVCGVRLGSYCLVGAGAVVTRDVPDFSLVVGNPAKQIGWVSRAGRRLSADLVCPETGEEYILTNGRLALRESA